MDPQLLREVMRGMDVVTADGQKLGCVADLYLTDLEPGPEPGALIADYPNVSELTGEGVSSASLAPSGQPGSIRIMPPFGSGHELLVPIASIARVADGAIVLRLDRDEIEHQRWEQGSRAPSGLERGARAR